MFQQHLEDAEQEQLKSYSITGPSSDGPHSRREPTQRVLGLVVYRLGCIVYIDEKEVRFLPSPFKQKELN